MASDQCGPNAEQGLYEELSSSQDSKSSIRFGLGGVAASQTANTRAAATGRIIEIGLAEIRLSAIMDPP